MRFKCQELPASPSRSGARYKRKCSRVTIPVNANKVNTYHRSNHGVMNDEDTAMDVDGEIMEMDEPQYGYIGNEFSSIMELEPFPWPAYGVWYGV